MLAGFWWHGFAGLFSPRSLAAVTSIWTDIMKRTMLYLSLLAVSCSVSAAKYTVLTESSPEKAGFNVERLNQMDRWISQQVDAGYPGVNLLIIKDNQIVYRKAWGAAKKYDGSTLRNIFQGLPTARTMRSKAKTRCGFLTCCITAAVSRQIRNTRIKRSRARYIPRIKARRWR